MNNNEEHSYQIRPIGYIHSPFTEKFGIPRQANLIHSAKARIELLPPYCDPDAVKGLKDFSHIWVSFRFHQNDHSKWRPLIRPPRLGGNEKIGVFASRSSFRPNGLGLSLLALKEVSIIDNKAHLVIACPDILSGTPIYDIKPYIHYADSEEGAVCAYADNPPEAQLETSFCASAEIQLKAFEIDYPSSLKDLIEETLSYDPRPAYKKKTKDDKVYTLRLYDLDICFKVNQKIAEVQSVIRVKG